MLGCTGRPGQQVSASLRLAIEQAPWWTHAGRMENAIVDDLDVLDQMADLSLPPAAAEAAGLQKNRLTFGEGLESARIGEGRQASTTAAQHRWSGIGLTEWAGKFSCVCRCLFDHIGVHELPLPPMTA